MSLTSRLVKTSAFIAGAAMAYRYMIRRHRHVSFANRVAVITGGSRGLGLVIARQLAAEGARLAILSRDADELERAVKDIAARGAQVLAIPCDVTERLQVDAAIDKVVEHFGRIDLLINNAGQIQVGPLANMRFEDFDQALRLHVHAPLFTTWAALPHLKRSGSGRIVNISSIGGEISPPHLLPYATSKFALVGLSEGLRSELARDNILVTTICPGLMRTGSPGNAMTKGQHGWEYMWFTVSDSSPLASVSAESAAHAILNAARHGDARLTISPQAKIAVAMHALFPEMFADVMALANKLLPGSGNAPDADISKPGKSVRPNWLPLFATRRSDQAAIRNNELGATQS